MPSPSRLIPITFIHLRTGIDFEGVMQLSFNYIKDINSLVLLSTVEMTKVLGNFGTLPMFLFQDPDLPQEEAEVNEIHYRWIKKGTEIHTNISEIGWFL